MFLAMDSTRSVFSMLSPGLAQLYWLLATMTSFLVLVQKCLKQKSFSAVQTVLLRREFSSHKLAPGKRNKRLANALRVIDIINPKKSNLENRGSHLQLIEDILATNVNERFCGNFATKNAKSESGITDVADRMLQYPVLQSENSSVHLGMQEEGSSVDVCFLSHVVSSCGSKRDLCGGIQYHCLAITSGFIANVYVGSSLISLYSKCTLLDDAYQVFEDMPVRNIVSWTAIIAAFAQEWHVDMCVDLFQRMMNLALKPNHFTYTSIISACGGSGALGHGRSVHCQIIQMGFNSHIHVANSLITMYCKCGVIHDALYIFENMDGKDVVSWNSMIAGYAQHGLAQQAIDLFEGMMRQAVNPDAITYLGVLSSCRHVGLVKEGQHYFNLMVEHGVKPEVDHYSCVVDLLGRAGLLMEAQYFIKNMPVHPNAVIWGSLLSSSRHHGSVWIGIQAAESRLLLEPRCPATLLQLANLYASIGWWDQVARVRKLMKDEGMKTNPGCSWIEVKNEVYRFGAEDKSNCRMAEILMLMDSLRYHMRILGLHSQMHEEDD